MEKKKGRDEGVRSLKPRPQTGFKEDETAKPRSISKFLQKHQRGVNHKEKGRKLDPRMKRE